MNVKRYIAPNMQEALKRVREELGADAMILSTRKVPEGMEVVCALDYNPEQARQEAPVSAPRPDAEVARRHATRRALLDEELERARQRIQKIQAGGEPEVVTRREDAAKEVDVPAGGDAAKPDGLVSEALAAMQAEIAALKALLSESAERPVRDPVDMRLTGLGLTEELSSRIVRNLPAGDEEARWQLALKALAAMVPVMDLDESERPCALALVGPTGAGKTTTIAKLAARWIQLHGREGLALVTTDCYRVGAASQLLTLGKLLRVPVHVVPENGSLKAVLDSLADHRRVLIDTAGLTSRDPNGERQVRSLQSCGRRVKKILVLSAVSQAQVMKSNYHYYKMLGLSGCVITKLDEACALGQALGLSIQEQLPIACYTDGQHIARDLHPATGQSLVARAVTLDRQDSPHTARAGLVG